MATTTRLEFWRATAEEFGLPLTTEQEREVDALLAAGDRDGDAALAVLDRWFPHLVDVERSEVLWALGEFTRRHARDDAAAGNALAGACAPGDALCQATAR